LGYYALLGLALVVLHRIDPELQGVFSADRFHQLATGPSGAFADPAGAINGVTPMSAAKESLVSMMGAYLLMLPVAWIYIFTRQKKGYRQALVQTLIILPIVVAGIIILVKTSTALAFGLSGIVAAVSFRSTVRDTKDAIYVFLAIGVGVAAGVQMMSVAMSLSMFFNLVILSFWWTDFGRVPAQLEGPMAQRRLANLRKFANRTGAFVSLLDTQILKSMAPEQLEIIADRARRRQKRFADQQQDPLENTTAEAPRYPLTLRLVTPTDQVETVRNAVEGVLTGQAKAWRFEAATTSGSGQETVLYKVRPKKSIPLPLLLESVRRAVVGKASSVELG
jgi:hypothetical protein